ncbi:MAG TPA: serine hydrolase domain-containing protein [Thermoanaerobaculia bacterium]|nr:serine hydrolase domain-containing protein [Thermoanaerobaculia bacterium]
MIPSRRRPLVLSVVLLAAAATAQAGAPAPLAAEQVAAIDAVFVELDSVRSPGCALGVVRGGELALARGYGMADLDHGIAITPRSVFRTGSVSKQLTAATVALVAADGDLSLDDEVRAHLPELPDYGAPLTLRHLIHHTSGIRDYLTLFRLAGLRDDDWYTDPEVMAMIARQAELNFAPGAEHLYSNSGYFLLSQVVLRATGKSLRQIAEERLFTPLGMRHSHFHDDHTEIVPLRATGYARRDDGSWRRSTTTLDMVGDGGVFTSIEDLSRWVASLDDGRLRGAAFRDSLYERGRLASGAETDYAFGLVHGTYRGLRTIGHGGAFVGYRADLTRFPDQGLGIVTLCNFAEAQPSRYARRVADVVLADRLEPEESGRSSRQRTEEEAEGAEGVEAPMEPVPADLRAAVSGSFYSPELDAPTPSPSTARARGSRRRRGCRSSSSWPPPTRCAGGS